ncbi:MAG TPA: hypothetical protein VD865_16950 [Stenotrophomonas sp.]|nr:hypothetical protein [Stenotrophomonas sp.]
MLEDFYRSYGFGKVLSANERIAPGDTVMVCNRGYCINYVRTSDGKWQGKDPSPLQQFGFFDDIKRLPPELAEDWLREQRKSPRQMLPPPASWGPTPPRRGVVTVGPISNP